MTATPNARPNTAHLTPLWVSFLVAIAYGTPSGVLNVAWETMSLDLGQPYERLGVLLSAGLIGRLSMTLFGGQILARLGIFRCMVIGLTGMILGFGLYFSATGWEMLLLGAMVAALGNGVMDIGLTLVVVSRYRAGTLNWMHAAFGVGLIIGPLLVTWVTAVGWGWRAAYLLPMVLSAVGLLITVQSRPLWAMTGAAGSTDSTRTRVSMRDTLRQRGVWLWLAIAFLYGGIEVGVGQLSRDMLVQERGVAEVTASGWISLYWLSFTLGRMLTSFLTRVPQYVLMRAYATGIVLGAGLFFIPNADLSLVALLVMGFSMAGFFPTQLTVLPSRVGAQHAPNALGFTISTVSIGLTALPALGAWLATQDALGGFAVVPPFILTIGVALLGLMLLARPKPADSH
jgi:fucose permease